MTPREAFERVRDHLLQQGRRSEDTDPGSCRYRGPGDARCAIGALVADDAYDPEAEGTMMSSIMPDPATGTWIVPRSACSVSSPFSDCGAQALARSLNLSGVTASVPMRDLLTELQHVHDVVDPFRWASRLAEVESSFVLD